MELDINSRCNDEKNRIVFKLFTVIAGILMAFLAFQFLFQYFHMEKFYVCSKKKAITNEIIFSIYSDCGDGFGDCRGILLFEWDEKKLEKVIRNFYYNAIKYTPENGTINIIVQKRCIFAMENSPAYILEAASMTPYSPNPLLRPKTDLSSEGSIT